MFAFDLDGTLVPNNMLKINSILTEMHLPEADPEVIRTHWGEPYYELISKIMESIGHPESVELFMEEEKKHKNTLKIGCELLMLLGIAKNNGHYLSLVTNRTRESTLSFSREIGLDLNVFHLIITSDCGYQKPDGRMFREVFYLTTQQACSSGLFFGDTIKYDLLGCRNANKLYLGELNFVAVESGVDSASDFLKYGVTDIVEGVNDLPRRLCELLGVDITARHYTPV